MAKLASFAIQKLKLYSIYNIFDMSAKLGTKTGALESISEMLHKYREDYLAMAKYHHGLAQEVEQAMLISILQKQTANSKKVLAFILHIGDVLQSCQNHSSQVSLLRLLLFYLMHVSACPIPVSFFTSSTQVLLTALLLHLKGLEENCHNFSLSLFTYLQFYHILPSGCHPNLSHKAFLFLCFPELSEAIST